MSAPDASGLRTIQSKDNPLYKRLLRLQRDTAFIARERRKGNAAVVLEGVHLAQMWLAHASQPETVLFNQAQLRQNRELQDLCAALPQEICIVLDTDLAEALSMVGHGPGVFCLVAPPAPELPERLAENALWLDRVQDPGNVGTLLRTAAAAGIRQAFLSRGCAFAWSPKALRAGQGAQFGMRIHEDCDLSALQPRLDIPMVVTALESAQSLYQAELPRACAWVFGNEGQGVSEQLLLQADLRLRIPQSDTVESLNVAASAAICLFEQRRRQLSA